MVLRLAAGPAPLGRPTAAGASPQGGRAVPSRRQAGTRPGRLPGPHLARPAPAPGSGVPPLVLRGAGGRGRRRWGVLFPLAAVCPRPAAGCSPSLRSRFPVRPVKRGSPCPRGPPLADRTTPRSDHARVVLRGRQTISSRLTLSGAGAGLTADRGRRV